MSLFRVQQRGDLPSTESVLTDDGRLIGRRAVAAPRVGTDRALRNSVMWGCLRLRADIISTLPVIPYRKVDGVNVDLPPPPILVNPGGDKVDIVEHLYSSQFDLDRCGNSVGVITEKDNTNLPRRIDLEPFEAVTVQEKDKVVRYKIGRRWYDAEDIWHEKQYTVSGLPVGLSPITYSALALGNYLSASQFARDWFDHGAVPSARFRNKARKVDPAEARSIKERLIESVRKREPLVHGNDWEYDMISVPANESQFLETIKATGPDICRYFGVPGDMVDVETSTGNITYANVTQRNLQLLIMNVGPAIVRRERAMSRWLPKPRAVRIDAAHLLRMDPASLATMLNGQVAGKTIAPSEARAVQGRAPFTPEQIQEMKELGIITKSPTPTAGQPENGAQS